MKEQILKPFKYADEQALRAYTSFCKNWERKGESRYALSAIASLTSLFCMANGLHDICPESYFPGMIIANLGHGSDLSRTYDEFIHKKDISDEVKVELPFEAYGHYGFLGKLMSKYARFPLLLSALGFTGKAGVEAYNGLMNGNAEQWVRCLEDVNMAVASFGLSSSMYLKDVDPDVLKKEPFWKTAFNWAREKVKSLVPKPLPELNPVPIQNMCLEERVE